MTNLIFVLSCAFCGAVGFLIGSRVKPFGRKKKPQAEPTEAQIRAARRAQIEYNNFLNYDGSEQEEIRG